MAGHDCLCDLDVRTVTSLSLSQSKYFIVTIIREIRMCRLFQITNLKHNSFIF